ncbi:phenylalanyl-tRNA synthetase, beta subunit family protein [Trichomonas vaginalis G3]|uniref:Phenylalanine--tRNA ligase beta subunit n=1 Tax=Trichomonas vaginalis (strain ATCC PRA-98 / G3) TaxID=412133 RepID=A2FR77_TRIV3|nr:phenylalanyl-tRNA synthetase beta chain and leucine-rich repeat-containing protein 47 family [Trichomonas vaginalis G3]EAX92593.1 phenylalanyl-tRNA synthetase, beta subunit family protein [Trichomonas vaginalis G3]KAI5533836.1 phenylalanyl-tRNA synthetase beta chain and leucine-rich repeat-containing protein 47 family [Trichomonas vaginalis G3]|eukprot:XP_001305523.1 phenylalanyl-tRNA synthetase, beta subunit family protein [Trichomonas vaginalis G3]
MPTVAIRPNRLYELMGVEPMTKEQISKLLMNFGLELDDETEEEGILYYKIDCPANRPDLLSVEGLAENLKCFQGKSHPEYKILPPQVSIRVDESVKNVRPFLVSAVIRGITFTDESLKSFIDFQDKLHMNLCRRRTLASIGTHDLDTVEAPFAYTAEKPEDIVFVPLTGGPEVNGRQLYEHLKEHQQLSKYLPLLDPFDTWPVVRDAKGRVMSLPPIINSDLSKITVNTRNVFIECTATDLTRAMTAVILLCTAFSIYCDDKYSLEQVKVQVDGKDLIYPTFDYITFDVDTAYIHTITSVRDLTEDKIIELLHKMQLKGEKLGDGKLRVTVPPTRSDVLHPCDIAEDVAIAYGYNAINDLPENRKAISSGRPLSMNEYVDRLSKEFAAALWDQILTFSLCSRKECYSMLNLEDDGKAAVLKNAKTIDFEIVRTSLLGGLLKVNKKILSQPNLKNILPLRLFECSDVVLCDSKDENNARNEKRLAATICDVKSRFQDLHGLLERFLILNGQDAIENTKLVRQDCPTCIPGQRAAIMYHGQEVGWIGVIHPSVLINFDMTKPVVAFELQVKPYFDIKHGHKTN